MPFFVAFFFEKTFDTFFGTYVFLNCKYCCAFFAYFQFKKKMLKIQFANSSKRITTSHEDTLDTRKEDSLKTLIWFFIPMSVYYFAIVGGESTFYANIFSYATCALSLPPKSSTILNSLFWAGFGIGRCSGSFGTKFIKTSIYILIDCAGIIARV